MFTATVISRPREGTRAAESSTDTILDGGRCATRQSLSTCCFSARPSRPFAGGSTTYLTQPGLRREKVLAAVVRLMEMTLARVGNPEYARQNQSFGLTTLSKSPRAYQGGRDSA